MLLLIEIVAPHSMLLLIVIMLYLLCVTINLLRHVVTCMIDNNSMLLLIVTMTAYCVTINSNIGIIVNDCIMLLLIAIKC